MELVVTMRKDVEDALDGKNLFEQLKQLLIGVADIRYSSHVIERDLEDVD